MADFMGFYFDNVHSSTYGLVRTSDGDRYKEGLIPEFEDREIELVGGDGSLYEGRRFKKTNFRIKVAFDNMTEQQLRELRTWLGTDELKAFRFDERPYKTYWVKPSKKPELSYICFMEDDEMNFEGNKIRVYKGEGEIEFTAYDPFGYCIDRTTDIIDGEWMSYPLYQEQLKKLDGSKLQDEKDKIKKFLKDEYQEDSQGYPIFPHRINWQNLSVYNPFVTGGMISGIDNTPEWGFQAGLYDEIQLQYFNSFKQAGTNSFRQEAKTYNPGDFESDFLLHLTLLSSNANNTGNTDNTGNTNLTGSIDIYISQKNEVIHFFKFSIDGLKVGDKVVLDTKTHSLIVYSLLSDKSYQKTMRYDLVLSTDFPKIPKGESTIAIQGQMKDPHIKYNYKYY
jgi:phage-related protein